MSLKSHRKEATELRFKPRFNCFQNVQGYIYILLRSPVPGLEIDEYKEQIIVEGWEGQVWMDEAMHLTAHRALVPSLFSLAPTKP